MNLFRTPHGIRTHKTFRYLFRREGRFQLRASGAFGNSKGLSTILLIDKP